MTTRLELSYLIEKHLNSDRFDSELPVEIPIQGQLKLADEADMDAAAATPNAFLGVRVQQSILGRILWFVRRSHAPGIPFPDVSADKHKFQKLKFRMLNSGQALDFVISYEIDNDKCEVVGANTPLGENWIALVTQNQGNYELLYRKDEAGPGGGGDPCTIWNCANTDNVAVKIKCVLNGCAI